MGKRCSLVLDSTDSPILTSIIPLPLSYLEGITEQCMLLCLQNINLPYHTKFLFYFCLGNPPTPSSLFTFSGEFLRHLIDSIFRK